MTIMCLLFYLASDIPVTFTVARNSHLPTNDGYVLVYVYMDMYQSIVTQNSFCLFLLMIHSRKHFVLLAGLYTEFDF